MLGHRAKLKGGGEWDVFSRWRRVLCYTSRSGVCKRVKRQFNKRQRKAARLSVANAHTSEGAA